MDRYIVTMTSHYGWPASERTVEYFWDADLALSACSRVDGVACSKRFSEATIVFSHIPLSTHELGHTMRVGRAHTLLGGVSFIEEGFATRWHSGILGLTNVPTSSASFLSEAELRAVLEAGRPDEFSYAHAFTWWVALELSYGPEKMAEFVAEIEGATSARHIEGALHRVFGISLAESAQLAKELPLGSIDDPACVLEGLPTFEWTGAPLVAERENPSCEDEDIVNASGSTAMWLFALNFPATPTTVEVRVTVPDDEDPVGKLLYLFWCSGGFNLGELPPTFSATAGSPGTRAGPWKLRGRYVGALRAPLEVDGSLVFPRVVYEEAAP